jgi:hypothetical protein
MKFQSGFLKFIIRFGYLAKGSVYLAVGLLALEVAVGFGGQTGDTKGALEEIGRHPFGTTLLVIIAVGLLHYSAWKFVEARTQKTWARASGCCTVPAVSSISISHAWRLE